MDLQGIVFNAHDLTYFDVGMTDDWRRLGLPYSDTMARLGGEPVVRKATLEYAASARLDDELDVALRCKRVGRTSWTMSGALLRGELVLASAEIVYVFVDLAAHTAQPVPAALRALFERFEAGSDVLSVETGPWTRLQALAAPLRRAVFVKEQGIPEHEEWDEADDDALQAVAIDAFGQAVGTGRLLRTDEPAQQRPTPASRHRPGGRGHSARRSRPADARSATVRRDGPTLRRGWPRSTAAPPRRAARPSRSGTRWLAPHQRSSRSG